MRGVSVYFSEISRDGMKNYAWIGTSREPLKSNLDLDPLIQDLRRLMDKLPESQRQAFTLVHMEGLSRAEAAIRLRCTLPQLRDRLYEAKLRLRGSVKGWNK